MQLCCCCCGPTADFFLRLHRLHRLQISQTHASCLPLLPLRWLSCALRLQVDACIMRPLCQPLLAAPRSHVQT